jgi:hypothetical protein
LQAARHADWAAFVRAFGMVLRQHNTQHLCWPLGELHGRNLASALMRAASRRQAYSVSAAVGVTPVLPEGSGRYRSEHWRGGRELVVKEIDAETVLEKCRALIKQIITDLSAEKPFVNASSAAALLLHLEAAAAALKRSFGPRPPEH